MRKFFTWVGKVFQRFNDTYMKRLVTFITVNAVGWVWCSYYLANKGVESAQELSREAVRGILAVVGTYGIKSLAENISKNGYVGKKRLTGLGNTDTEGDSREG